MYHQHIIVNLGMSLNFGPIEFNVIDFPVHFLVRIFACADGDPSLDLTFLSRC